MSKFHHFQRYSQKENVVTNNVIILFSWFQKYLPSEFYNLINDFIDNPFIEFDGGVQFFNQYKVNNKNGARSVPDGAILQNDFKIIFETKLEAKGFDIEQLKSHCKSFNNESLKILFAISPNKIDYKALENIQVAIENINNERKLKNNNKIILVHKTFNELSDMIKTRIKEYNIEMNEIIDDFNQYCYDQKLISNTKLRVVNATSSLRDNQKYNLYYCPISYNLGYTEFFGLSSNKSVRFVGKLLKIIEANNLDNENASYINVHGSEVTIDEKSRIKEAYKSALNFKEKWDISNNHRFYIVDEFEETDFKKTSKYIFQQSKIFELEDYINVERNINLKNLNSKQIADYLRNKTWE